MEQLKTDQQATVGTVKPVRNTKGPTTAALATRIDGLETDTQQLYDDQQSAIGINSEDIAVIDGKVQDLTTSLAELRRDFTDILKGLATRPPAQAVAAQPMPHSDVLTEDGQVMPPAQIHKNWKRSMAGEKSARGQLSRMEKKTARETARLKATVSELEAATTDLREDLAAANSRITGPTRN